MFDILSFDNSASNVKDDRCFCSPVFGDLHNDLGLGDGGPDGLVGQYLPAVQVDFILNR